MIPAGGDPDERTGPQIIIMIVDDDPSRAANHEIALGTLVMMADTEFRRRRRVSDLAIEPFRNGARLFVDDAVLQLDNWQIV